MKRILIFAITASLFTACKEGSTTEKTATTENAATSTKTEFYGEKITEDNAKPVDSLQTMMGDSTAMNCKLSGTIDAVCQTKGCWMELKNSSGSPVRVTFKDYAFFMPKDAAGRTAIIDGIAKIEETSIADLKEYAKDDGKKQEEIDAIKEPLKELVFEAKGVILK